MRRNDLTRDSFFGDSLSRIFRRRTARTSRFALTLEPLECRRLLDSHGAMEPANGDPGNDEPAQVHGFKWNDLNANGRHDEGEPGLAGVVVYADLNNNGNPDNNEPRTVTMADDPRTAVNETGFYWLDPLPAGEQAIREVVPDGFVQTFPPRIAVDDGVDGGAGEPGDDFSSVHPEQISVTLAAGEMFETNVSLTIHPFCVRPYEVDVVASEPGVAFENLTGILINECGGDTSTFEVGLIGDGENHNFELQFVDSEFGGILDTIPVQILAEGEIGGAHIVQLEPGAVVDGIDFGNHRVTEPGSIHGRKWNDLDRDGRQDPDEPGLPGVTIYIDRNNNGQLDPGESRTVTMEDDPVTDFDEGGLYWLDGVRPGEHIVREVVPDGFVQTFPGRRARVTGSESGRFQQGVALDFDITGVEIVPSSSTDGTTIDLELTVVWPNSCGSIVQELTTHTVINHHILVQMFGEQVGNVCAEVISPESQTIRMEGLDHNRYRVVGVLSEDLGHDEFVPTLAVVGGIVFEAHGSHHLVHLEPGSVVDGIDFGNHQRRPGSAHGVKWLDRNGNGERDDNEPGLPGVIIYSDLNFNGRLDEGEPRTRSMEDDPDTAVDEAGHYWLEDLTPGLHVIREVVPDGSMQTFPRLYPFEVATFENVVQLPFRGGGHAIRVEPGQAVEGLDFGNRPVEPGSVHGTKWVDRNGNRRHDDNEPGLAGVVIYSDLNGNGRLDDDEPHTRTMEDDPETAADETGRYWLRLDAGRHVIREIVPDGFVQTFPPTGPIPLPHAEIDFRPDVFPIVSGAHVVHVEPEGTIEGLDFGNRPRHRPGDANGDGHVDAEDFRIWFENRFSFGGIGQGDFSGDGIIDVTDFNIWNLYKFTEVPGVAGAAAGTASPVPRAPLPAEPSRSGLVAVNPIDLVMAQSHRAMTDVRRSGRLEFQHHEPSATLDKEWDHRIHRRTIRMDFSADAGRAHGKDESRGGASDTFRHLIDDWFGSDGHGNRSLRLYPGGASRPT